MPNRTALLLTATALLAKANLALAQDNLPEAPADEPVEWQQYEVVQPLGDDASTDEVSGASDEPAADAYVDERYALDAAPEMHRPPHRRGRVYRHHRAPADMHNTSAPRLAYTPEQRESWLADCRIVMRGEDYYQDDAHYESDNDDGGLLGGLLGAIVGGVAGNRIGGAGDRLAGTLIGAGVGGIAGAVIGSAIDHGNDDDYDRRPDGRQATDAWAGDYCAAYLRRYEASGQAGSGQIAYAQVVPVMTAQPVMRHGAMREIVREEWVEVEAEQPAPQPRRPAAPRREAPARGKLTSVQ